jgi:predicted DNA-binding protein (MmcQ/YjbR family)
MTAKQLEVCCGVWPGVSSDIKWGAVRVLSIDGKMFAVTPSDGSEGGRLSFKVPDECFLELTDQPGIIPAPYLARSRWICIIDPTSFSTDRLEAFALESYALVRAKLSRKRQAELAPLPTLNKGRS